MDTLHVALQDALAPAYSLGDELGGGGMSRVFRARDNELERDVVVKVLSPDLASTVSAQRFTIEVHATAVLQHPHIVPVLRAGHAAGELPFYVMPYVHGETLRARIERGRVPFYEAVQLLSDVSKALAAAHEAEVVHRDVKPENILLSGGAAVVTDFGIARALHEARAAVADATLTTMGTSLGTPAYMAPEQACGDAIDARTDVYSWGVVAYHTIAGHHPFTAATTAQKLIAAHIAERPRPLSHLITETPAWFCRLVMSCLAKDPAGRPANGAALTRALEIGLAGHRSPVERFASAALRLFGARDA